MSNKTEVLPPEQANPFEVVNRNQSSQPTIEIATTRQAQEVQAAMAVAKRFPRNEEEAYARIMTACQRKSLAEQSSYSYPKGGQTVSGPSIRLAEVLAQSWGNMDFGIVELDQRNGESTVMAFAWDLQTNTRQTKVFQVSHSIKKKDGSVKRLDDPRDIYEMVANQGARRMRACILGIIPGDIADAAVAACDKTLEGGSSEPLVDRVRKMIAAFAEFGVTVPMIEKRLQHKADIISEHELVGLRKIYLSLRDRMGKREDFFDFIHETTTPDMPKEEAEKPVKPTDTTPSPATTQEITVFDQLYDALNEDGVKETELLSWCVGKKLAKDTQTIKQLSTAKVTDILNSWNIVVPEIQAARKAS